MNMQRVFSFAQVRRPLPEYLVLASASLILAVFLVTQSWIPLALEVGALAAIFTLQPGLGLLLAVVSIPFSFAHQHIGGAEISPTDLLIASAAAGWVVRQLWIWRRGQPEGLWTALRGIEGIDWAVLFFLVVCLASLLVAEDMRAGLWELRVLVVQPMVLYLLVRTNPSSQKSLLRLGDALVLGGALLALTGLYYYYFRHYVEAAEGVRRLLVPFFDSPNHIGLFLGRVLPVAASLALFASDSRRRALHSLALIPILACIYLTYSRGTWFVGLPASLLFIALMPAIRPENRARRTRWYLLGALALALLAIVPVARTARFASITDFQGGTSFLRLLLWKGTLRMIAVHPVSGVGLGTFALQYPRYMLPEAWREPLLFHPHNMVLDFWAILGLPGVAALVWLQVVFWRSGVSLYRRLIEPDMQALMLGLMGSMVNFLAHGLVDTAYFLADLALVFMLTLGITRRLTQFLKETDSQS